MRFRRYTRLREHADYYGSRRRVTTPEENVDSMTHKSTAAALPHPPGGMSAI
jgi:hypothetical protein